MSIQFKTRPSGGFGNRLFQLNFLGQLARYIGTDYKFLSIKDYQNIENTNSWGLITQLRSEKYTLDQSFFNKERNEALDELVQLHSSHKRLIIEGNFLGDYFYDYNVCSPKDVVRIKSFAQSKEPYISMHFRGTDFKTWNDAAILNSDYYSESLDYVDRTLREELPIIIVTDDMSLPNLMEVFNRVKKRAIIQSSRDYIKDFKTVVNSTAAISSPSTFAIWGGILGNQEIITHSQNWVKERAEAGDKFWSHLNQGGSSDYSCILIDY